MTPRVSIGPRTLLNDCDHSATAIFWRAAIRSTLSRRCFTHIFTSYFFFADGCITESRMRLLNWAWWQKVRVHTPRGVMSWRRQCKKATVLSPGGTLRRCAPTCTAGLEDASLSLRSSVQYSIYSEVPIAIRLSLLTKVIRVSRDFPIGCNELIPIVNLRFCPSPHIYSC